MRRGREACRSPRLPQIGDEVGPLARVAHSGEGHRGFWRDRLGIGEVAVEQGLAPALPPPRQGTQGRRIVEPLAGDAAADDTVQGRTGEVVPARLEGVAGVAFPIGDLAAAQVAGGASRGERRQAEQRRDYDGDPDQRPPRV